MKIAITSDAIYPFTLGGSEIRNHEIAKRLVKKGHEVHIYGAKLWEGKSIIEKDGVILHGVSKYKRLYTRAGKRSVLKPLKLSINLFFQLLKERYDVIDNAAFTYFNCISTKLISIIKKTPLVFTWHQYFGDYLARYFGKFLGGTAKAIEKLSTKLTNFNLAVSNKVKKDLVKRGVENKNIEVIYNGVDINTANSLKNTKKRYDLIFVGRFNYQKNLKLLIESAAILKKDFPNIRVCLIGSGEEKENLIKLIKELKLGKNFDFLGELKDKREIFSMLKASKIFVLPSILEGFPLTILEANACGLPVITTKTKWNNAAEYIKNKENGIFSKPDKGSFSSSISYLLKNKKLLEKMSKISKEKVKNFDWDEMADKVEAYYQKIINKSNKGG